MTVSDLFNELCRRGIEIELIGEKIKLYGSSKKDFDESLVNLIRAHKAEIIATLSADVGTDLKGRPNWCTKCHYGGYKIDDTGSQALWCGLINRAVLDIEKCTLNYWAKNEKGRLVTLQ